MRVSLSSIEDQSDADVLRAYAEGHAQAAAILTERLLPRVYHHARRRLGNEAEAEDAAQDAMMRLWQIAPDWRRGEAQISTWLYRVTENLCTDRLRRRRSVPLDDIAEPLDETPGAAAQMQTKARDAALRNALDTLPDRQRQAVELRHLEGWGNPQIADIMEITPRAVESLIARGKRALSAQLMVRRAELGYDNDTE